AVRRALRDDAGRTAAKHGERALLHVRAGLQVVGPGFRLGGGVPAVPDDSGGHRDARALGPWSGAPMREPLARWLLHLLLLGALALVLASLAGYAFAKLRFRGRESLLRLLLAALVIPSQVAMLPLFLMMKWLGLVNTYAGVVIPAMAGIFGVFLVRQYALAIPDELLEAARIDGAGEMRIFQSIVLPALRPILVTLGVLTFLGSWNDFMWPLIVLTDQNLYTLPIALATLSREHVQDNELMMAGAVLTVLPVLLLFLALQRYYIRGILVGSVKG